MRRVRLIARKLATAVAGGVLALIVAGAAVVGFGIVHVADEVEAPTARLEAPTRLYARPLEVCAGRTVGIEALALYLEALGYREAATSAVGGSPSPATFAVVEGSLRFTTRIPLHPAGPAPRQTVTVTLADGIVESIAVDGVDRPCFDLEPVELRAFHDAHRIERRDNACSGGTLPETVAQAILAAEDDGFRRHFGVSPTGIARAALRNLSAGEIREGGSTITQQLARNRFLTQERSWERKAKEALMALVLDARHPKDEILCAYADLVYLGARDGLQIVGVGAAAASYFGKAPEDLTHAEAATIAGMIAAPSRFSPLSAPDRAAERRDWVLRRMRELGWIDAREHGAAIEEELRLAAGPGFAGVDARYYADAVRHELETARHLNVEQAGLRIDGTLDWLDQYHAERAVEAGLDALEQRYAASTEGDFQVALLSVDPRLGGVRAYVGGRDYDVSQFDRVQQARRQIGSLFKPIVFASAFSARKAHPGTPVADRPIAIQWGDELWTPRNYGGRYRGTVTAQRALELSINSATLRLAAATGLADIRRQAENLGFGVGSDPAVVLGAVEASPWQVAEAFATFARDGRRFDHTTIEAVRKPDGEFLHPRSRDAERVFDPETVHILNTSLQGVIRRGTAASARRAGLEDPLAGKTGTSNDRRDSWFVGYSPDRLSLVWTGRDGFGETPFTGSTGALPIWTRFTLAVRPVDGFQEFRPQGLDDLLLDFDNGEIWPVCPDDLLHPSYPCTDPDDEPLEAETGDGGFFIAPEPAPLDAVQFAALPLSGSRRFERIGDAGSIELVHADRAPSAAWHPVGNDLVSVSDLGASYELRDFLKLSRAGHVVTHAIQRIPIGAALGS